MAKQTKAAEQSAAQAMIQAVFDDKKMEINGRTYQFTNMTHKQRRKVFAFLSRIGDMMARKDFSFLDWPDFEPVEAVIESAIMFEGSTISKLTQHWDTYPGDYMMYITTAMQVISWPFLDVSRTD